MESGVVSNRGLPAQARTLLSGLNESQQEAACALSGPVRILAGAGTGKTRTITHRIAVQVAAGAARADEILAVTFTDRAARELRDRLRALGLPTPVRAATFHAAAWAQLRYFWPQLSDRPRPEVLTRKARLLGPLAERMRVDVRDLAGEIEWGKARATDPEGYPNAVAHAHREPPADAQLVAEAWAAYESAKADRDLIDYDDMLLRCEAALRTHPEIAEAVRSRYRVFTVDEFQDVNPAQWQLLATWLGDRRDLCVVGDANQTIYRFTGASPDYLTRFTERFPHATTVQLYASYRSTRQVLRLANRVLGSADTTRKRLTSTVGDGPAPTLRAFADEAAERDAVVAAIRELIDGGTVPGEIAVCYRINSQSADWEEALGDAGVPYIVRGQGGFFAHQAIKQALAALHDVAATHPDGPPRPGEPAGPPDTVRANAPDPAAALERVLRQRLSWQPDAAPAGAQARDRWEHLLALRDLAHRLVDDEPARFRTDGGFAALVAELGDRAAAGQETAHPDGAVTLLTLHRAKGLEFDAVFLVTCEEGLLPISHAETDEEIEDERRLLYVGVTRARRHLWLSWAERRGNRRRRRSRLLAGLPGLPRTPQSESDGGGARGQRRREGKTCRCGAPLVSAADRTRGRCVNCRADDPAAEAAAEALRAWRARRAADDGVPAFVIAHDRTLSEIADRAPDSLEGLGAVPGIGPAKLARYGEDILQVLAQAGSRERQPPPAQSPEPTSPSTAET